MSIDPFNRLVKLAARAFYDEFTTKSDNQQKTGRSDDGGISVVVLDALTRRQWVRKEDLAKDLKLHSKQLHTAKGVKLYSVAVAATADGQQTTREGEEKINLHTQSYCCLDYSQVWTAAHEEKIKDELESKNTVQEFICLNCNRRYTALVALRLVSMEDEFFHCENCNGELVAESDTLALQGGGDGDDNARRRRREKLKVILQKMEVQLEPLVNQLNRVKDLPAPEFGGLQAWEARANAAGRAANGNSSSNDPSKSSQGLRLPFLVLKARKRLPKLIPQAQDLKLSSWMIKQGMNLTKEQCGEVKQELKMDGSTAAQQFVDEKKPNANDDNKNIQDEYTKAYYAALFKRQQELEEAAKKPELSHAPISNNISESSSNRQVGMKAKREEDNGEDDVEWEEASTTGHTYESYRINDLNMDAAEASGEDEDDVDWEEG